ncbi:hypothetical protein [Leptospira terpstrae]|uniref:Uncharacterized protein n=1 Tax=Leptospira terpstrae serovar Hualin str. LT 11-33 = ATCC 700639 TaxID=1257025 RepID=N1W5Q3_9LEPT|nr:hypothetical protein [Leptospira terpstrae]EMY63011.1 hypothetical protein LEP1GSC203_3245 [Leptospira terpstrae serovar Hualin str. LT 11-33 = ATCC 700639]
MKAIKWNIGYGFLSWFVPFFVSIFFFSKDGGLQIDLFLFKTIMIVVGSLSGCFLLYRYFLLVDSKFLKEGFVIGISWLFINWLLDILVLIPMSKMPMDVYFIQIGFRYLSLLFFAIAMGAILERKVK